MEPVCESFEHLKLNDWIINQLTAIGISKPSAVQRNCIPPILEGRDCIGCDKTGSGKTLAFSLPILQKLSEDPYGIFALILIPTRELAYQIFDQINVIGKPINIKTCVVTGGIDMVSQGASLSQLPHIVVATPGRLVDHLTSCDTFSLSKIKFLVLDEADELLGGRFDGQLKELFAKLPSTRQTLLFSATITDTLERLKNIVAVKPFFWEGASGPATVDQLNQFYVVCPANVKDGYLVHMIELYHRSNPDGTILVFTSTCKHCQVLSMSLNKLGFECSALHSVMTQKARLASLAKFKSNHVKILLATDVASRGLDISDVNLVINHNVPNVPKNYIHRVGRTARAMRRGLAITLVTQNDIKRIQNIENLIQVKLKAYDVEEKEVVKILTHVAMTTRESEIQLDEMDFDEKRVINKRKKLLLNGVDPDEYEKEKKKRRKMQRRNRMRPNIDSKA